MARGSRLAARGSRLAARGSRLAARGSRLAARGLWLVAQNIGDCGGCAQRGASHGLNSSGSIFHPEVSGMVPEVQEYGS